MSKHRTLRERRILRLRSERWTYQQIADELGVTRQAIHQLLRRLGAAGRLPRKEKPPKPRRTLRNEGFLCKAEGCSRPAHCRQLCWRHYTSWLRDQPGKRERIAEAQRRYLAKPDVRERIRERQRDYRARPESRERQRERGRKYRADPEVRERRRQREGTPEARERARQRQRRYRTDPEVRERARAWHREYARRKRIAAEQLAAKKTGADGDE